MIYTHTRYRDINKIYRYILHVLTMSENKVIILVLLNFGKILHAKREVKEKAYMYMKRVEETLM